MLPDHPTPSHRLQGLPAVSFLTLNHEHFHSPVSGISMALQSLWQKTVQVAQDLQAQRLIRSTAGKSPHLVEILTFICSCSYLLMLEFHPCQIVMQVFSCLFVWAAITSLIPFTISYSLIPFSLIKFFTQPIFTQHDWDGSLLLFVCLYGYHSTHSLFTIPNSLIPFSLFPLSLSPIEMRVFSCLFVWTDQTVRAWPWQSARA